MSDIDIDPAGLDWDKGEGLLPAVVQHARSGAVLMLGYMNRAALEETRRSGRVTFWSRSRQRLWTKGESSGHVLRLVGVRADCDRDTLLVQAEPEGPTCHLGTATCFGADSGLPLAFLAELDALVARRERERPPGSYTTRLFEGGLRRMAAEILLVGLVVLTLQGLAVAHALLGPRKGGRAWLTGLYVALVVLWPYPMVALAVLGWADAWVDFRRRFYKS